jgi:hypothetical protein
MASLSSLPTDLSTKSNTEIDSIIKALIDDYNSHGNTFSNALYGPYITSTLVPQLQQMVGANPATDLQEMIQQDTQIDIDILQAKEDLKVAESRAASLRNKEAPSYYQSWFPLNRPLRSSSNIIILAIGIFFFLLSLLTVLQTAGFSIRINNYWTSEGAPESPILQKLRILFPFGYGTGLIILAVITVALVGFLRKS